MQVAILSFRNAHRVSELVAVLKQVGLQPELFSWKDSLESLQHFPAYIFLHDFITPHEAALIVATPVFQSIKTQHKPILGIAGGAQLLLASGLIPGVANNKSCITTTAEQTPAVAIKVSSIYQLNAFTRHLQPTQIFPLKEPQNSPRFVVPPALMIEMQLNGLDVLHYEDDSAAALANKSGNIMAMLSLVGEELIFRSLRDALQQNRVYEVAALNYYPRG